MRLPLRILDFGRKKKSREFAQELSAQIYLSPMCSDYENLFAQVRPFINEMKNVKPYGVTLGRNPRRLPDTKTPELYWLNDPNDEMGWSEFADLMFSTWLTEDELDIHAHFSGKKIIGYTVIPPQCRMYLGYGRWQWQVITSDGMKILKEDEVMRLRFSRSPKDVQMGVSPATASRVWAQIDDLISQYQKAYFENGAIPATITFITASTEDRYKAVRKELEDNLKGARNRNKTVYAWRQFDNDSGSSVDQVEVKTIQGNNSTLAIREIVEIINDRLNKSVGVSNFILGDDSSAKYDNAELSRRQFILNRVYPALMSFWNQFQHELERLTGYELGYAIDFDLEIPELTEREKVKAEIARIRQESLTSLIAAGSSAEAAVKALELPECWLGAAQGIYAKALTESLPAPISVNYALPAKTSEKAEPKPTVDKACTCRHSCDKLPPMTKQERELYDTLVEFAASLKESDGMLNPDDLIAKMTEILQADAADGAMESLQYLKLIADPEVAKELAAAVKAKEIYTSESLASRIASRAEQLGRGYATTIGDQVAEVLKAGGTANEIKEKLAAIDPSVRADLIARNETLYAIRSGRLEQDQHIAQKYGLDIKLVWRTSHDGDVCPVCAAMDGKTVDLGKAFPDTVETADGEVVKWEQSAWNDSGRVPDAHVNCRCYFDEVLA